MRLIDNYILKSIIFVFLSTIFVFCFLYILIDITSNLSEIIDRKVGFAILFQYYSSFLPIIFVQTSPFACLIATLLTFSRLNKNNEIIALRASGLNFWQITKPTLFFCVLVSIFILWVNERFVPRATLSSDEIRNENLILKADSEERKQATIKNLTFYGLKNRLYYIDAFNPNTFELQGITIIGQDNHQNLSEKINALTGKWTGIAWKFYQCQINLFDPVNINVATDTKYYDEKLMDIKETPQDFLRQRLNVSAMNAKELHDYIVRFSNSGATKALQSLKVDFYEKLLLPFGNIIIVLVGMPLTMTAGRRKTVTFSSLGIAIGIGFLFQVIKSVGLAMGKQNLIPAFLAAGIAPIVFLGVAVYLIRTKF